MSAQEEREVRDYVLSQGDPDRDESVTVVQRTGQRRVVGTTYDLCDVHMNTGDRYWVTSPPMNCYAQADFPQMDMALTYHIGLRYVLQERFTTEPGEVQTEYVSKPWRLFERARESMAEAVEVDDYMSVGVRCREALVLLAHEHQDADWVRQPAEPPKKSDAKAWLDLYARSLTTGRARDYFVDLAVGTWGLANWLTHSTSANEWDAQLTLDATAHFLNTFTLARMRAETEDDVQCERCGSRQLQDDSLGELIERDGTMGSEEWSVCLNCGWQSEHVYEPWPRDRLERLLNYATGEWSPPQRSMDELDPNHGDTLWSRQREVFADTWEVLRSRFSRL